MVGTLNYLTNMITRAALSIGFAQKEFLSNFPTEAAA
jgi:hypothetical protein